MSYKIERDLMYRFVQAMGMIVLTICLTTAVRQVSGQEIAKSEPSAAAANVSATPAANTTTNIRALLKSPVTFKFENVSLPKAILLVAEANHVPLTQQARSVLAFLATQIPDLGDLNLNGPDRQKIDKDWGKFFVTADYKQIPLRTVLNDLCRFRGELSLYWIITDELIDVGYIRDGAEMIPVIQPVVRVYEVTSLISPADVPEAADKSHPLVKAVLDAGETGPIALTCSELRREPSLARILEGSATLLKSNGKSLLIVRHHVLAHHEIENLLEQLNTAVAK